MTEIILVLLIFLTQKKCRGGFSQLEETQQNQVFFVNEWEEMIVVVNGFNTGIMGSGSIFVDPCQETLFVEYYLHGVKIGGSWVPVTHEKLFVMGPEYLPMPKFYPI